MSAGGEITVELSAPGFASGRVVLIIPPGTRHLVQLAAVDGDGNPKLVEVSVSVRGAVCPDPAAHEFDCDETDYSVRGDCDGTVREYIARAPVAGRAVAERVRLCASHAQMHGRNIRALGR